MTRLHDGIEVVTDAKNHRYHLIYDRTGKVHKIGQLEDALTAIRSGGYFAEKPVVEKAKKRK